MRISLMCLFVLMVSGASASAQDYSDKPVCGPFEVRVAKMPVQVIDLHDEGLSVGDRRLGAVDLLASDGKVLGESIFDAHVVDEREGLFRLIGNVFHIYDGGKLHYAVIYELQDPSNPTTPVERAPLEHHVTGGTGLFTGARGTFKDIRTTTANAWSDMISTVPNRLC